MHQKNRVIRNIWLIFPPLDFNGKATPDGMSAQGIYGVTLGILLVLNGVLGVTQDVCSDYDFSASCGENQILVMETALYGRMVVADRCITAEIGHIGCTNDVMRVADNLCSGRRTCAFEVNALEKYNTECNKNLKSYLHAGYTCVNVLTPRASCFSHSPVTLVDKDGMLASHMTDETGCGSYKAPWSIEAKSGQTVDIVLIDFEALKRHSGDKSTGCTDVYGYILEKSLNINQTICGKRERETLIYRSKTNMVQVRVRRKSGYHFLLKYKLNGCADLIPSEHSSYVRKGNEAVIGCKTNNQEWRLTCKGNTWDGTYRNCTKPVAAASKQSPTEKQFSTVVFVAGIVGGTVVLAVGVIVCGIVYIQKYKAKKEKTIAAKAVVRRRRPQHLHHLNQTKEPERPSSMPTTEPPRPRFRPLSTATNASGNDDYLQPRQVIYSQSLRSSMRGSVYTDDDTLTRTMDSSLSEPMGSNKRQSRDSTMCSVHSCGPQHRDSRLIRESETDSLTRDKCGTSYYSPKTGHKYYVLERDQGKA